MRVILAGGSGFIGSALHTALAARGDEVIQLVRREPRDGQLAWNPGANQLPDLPAVDAVINLAGCSIGSRLWTTTEKNRILSSRVTTTSVLANAVVAINNPPSVLVNASAVGFYGDRGDEVLTEDSAPGTGFLAGVVRAWESAVTPATKAGVRTVLLRTGIVLGSNGGIVKRLRLPTLFGGGVVLGSGQQVMSWIALEDEVRAILFALDNASIRGPVNLTAPHPVTNATFTKALASAWHRPTLVRVPLPVLSLLGPELAHELTGSQYAVPEKLTENGFSFAHEDFAEVFEHL